MPSEYVLQRWAEIRAEQLAKLPSPEEIARRNREIIAHNRRLEKRQRSGHVYFMRAGNAVKIGFSTNLAERQRSLLTACPEPAFICKVLPGTQKRERELHERFAEYRLRGEWFDLRGRLAKYLERNIYPIELPGKVEPEPEEDFSL